MSRTSSLKARVAAGLVPVLPVRDAVHFPGLVNTLHVVRERSLRAVKLAMAGDQRVVVLSQRDMALEDPGSEDLHTFGVLSEALQAHPLPDGSYRVALRGLRRIRVKNILADGGFFWGEIEEVHEPLGDSIEAEALRRSAVESFTTVVQLNKNIPPETIQSVIHLEDPGTLADAVAHHLPITPAEKQVVLELIDPVSRLEAVLKLLKREEQILDLSSRIHQKVEREIGDSHREFYLREQLQIIQKELQEREDRVGELDEYRTAVELALMNPEAYEKALTELKRLDRTPPSSPEGMVLRNYLDCLVGLPWSRTTEDRLDIHEAKALLERDHFGLDQVKNRILDFLAVRQLTGSLRGPILCFVGPPGVGKTSFGRSIAEAMGRKFIRLGLGGVRDEAEIRGHRRTYVGSMPGRIIQGVRQCGVRNPVFMLDELDKLGNDGRGDPTSALLEALDPEQNEQFGDHYLEAPFDLSAVMFIATANVLENVPAPLRDRMEVIEFPSYTDEERLHIAREYLLPKALEEHGLQAAKVKIEAAALKALVSDYTREAGVRSLRRQIQAVCRKAARAIAENPRKPLHIDQSALRDFLGRPRFRRSESASKAQVGVATGLVVSQSGGDLITIEASLMEPQGERPALQLTGYLGTVMQESAQAALTCVRSMQAEVQPTNGFRHDVHVHVPEGGIPKDGPSAGVTIAIALASAFSGRAVRADVAMTGEITLRGRVLPVGGIRDKVLAAHRAGIRTVVIPHDNEPDLDDIPAAVRAEMDIRPVAHLKEVVDIALSES